MVVVPFYDDGEIAICPTFYGLGSMLVLYLVILEIEFVFLGLVKTTGYLFYLYISLIRRRIGIGRVGRVGVIGQVGDRANDRAAAVGRGG